MRRMRRFELRRIAELERKIPHPVAPIDLEEACRAYKAMLAQEHEETSAEYESMTAIEAMERYQRLLKSGDFEMRQHIEHPMGLQRNATKWRFSLDLCARAKSCIYPKRRGDLRQGINQRRNCEPERRSRIN
jgi:hypothetical protein